LKSTVLDEVSNKHPAGALLHLRIVDVLFAKPSSKAAAPHSTLELIMDLPLLSAQDPTSSTTITGGRRRMLGRVVHKA
jgi:hypothetical protein